MLYIIKLKELSQEEASRLKSSLKTAEIPNVKILQSKEKFLHSNVIFLHSNEKNLHSYTYTEITTETKNRERKTRARGFGNFRF